MNPIWQRLLTDAVVGCFGLVLSAQDQDKDKKQDGRVVVTGTAVSPTAPARPDATTEGTVTVGGQVIEYRALAGTLTVGATDTQDATLGLDGQMLAETGDKMPDPAKPEEAPPTARMFYTVYFKKGAPSETRPVTFLYNGGPGSSTMWLHMGSFGPRRVLTTDTQHDSAAPYKIVNNQFSLLDASDLVFIDGPGTGFSRIMGKDKEKAFSRERHATPEKQEVLRADSP
jgi:carboxypeptidase C (cathepsin A)